MNIGEFLLLIWNILTFPKYFFRDEFWQGLFEQHVGFIIIIILVTYWIYNLIQGYTQIKKENSEVNRFQFWKKSFWFYKGGYPKYSFLIIYLIFILLLV